jgi:hypothetical protein
VAKEAIDRITAFDRIDTKTGPAPLAEHLALRAGGQRRCSLATLFEWAALHVLGSLRIRLTSVS